MCLVLTFWIRYRGKYLGKVMKMLKEELRGDLKKYLSKGPKAEEGLGV